ncbi:hypothetical protein [Deinococcus sp. QL22]|uniref:hypothetical protein n=1 Tax=Deinococcus sp. QL22 TaxID=2939437 RepID=UPI002016FB2D|nr:hypothetical protein [Deinococcus sp. QL22]UQN09951.1 hypothetical protein M1R55_27695 [Deinococcus sp. QL22]
MEFILVMASMTILMMVLAFLTLTREDREIVQEQLALDAASGPELAAAPVLQQVSSRHSTVR